MTRKLQQLIHVGARELGLDAEARRELQERATGKRSLKAMSRGELERVLHALENAGFKKRPKGRHPAAPRADLRLVHVLWGKLGRAGKLDKPGRDGLNAFIRARFGAAWGSVPVDVDALRDWEKIDAVIQALMQWCAREGIEVDRGETGREGRG